MSVLTYRLMAVAGIFVISFSPILIRASEEASDLTIAFFRSFYAIPFLALLYWRVRDRDEDRDQRPRRNRYIAVASGMLLALDLVFWHASIRQIGAGLATLLANVQVVFVALIAWAAFGEKPGRRAIGLIPVIFLGIALVSAFFYALFILLLRESGRNHATPSTGPVLDASIGAAAVALFIGLGFESSFDLSFEWPVHGWLLLLSLLAQVVGWPIIAKAMPHLPALDTSILILAQPMLAILWAGLIFDEALGISQWLGVALVLSGLLLFSLRNIESGEARQESGKPIDEPV